MTHSRDKKRKARRPIGDLAGIAIMIEGSARWFAAVAPPPGPSRWHVEQLRMSCGKPTPTVVVPVHVPPAPQSASAVQAPEPSCPHLLAHTPLGPQIWEEVQA